MYLKRRYPLVFKHFVISHQRFNFIVMIHKGVRSVKVVLKDRQSTMSVVSEESFFKIVESFR